MPWNVSGFCPQTLAFAPNVEHWDMRSLDKPLLIWPTSRRSCKLRSHIADGLTMRALYPDIGEALMGILQDETPVNLVIALNVRTQMLGRGSLVRTFSPNFFG